MRIVFWGTADFALPTLRRLAASDHAVAAVVTQPDRPAGRGRKMRATPVKEEAEALGLPLVQPEKPSGPAFVDSLRSYAPDLSVVAAYGEILPEEVLDAPARGSLNVHASLLPALRGAAPINWAIIRGHERTGITIMRMVRELDAGPILHQVEVPIGPEATAGDLFELLSTLGAEALLEVLGRMVRGVVDGREQDHDAATYAPKLGREEARLDWSRSAVELDRWVRGCDPWPGAWSELEGTPVQLFGSRPHAEETEDPPGTVVLADQKRGLRIACGDGQLAVGRVKPAGRTRMTAEEWIRGRGAEEGARFV